MKQIRIIFFCLMGAFALGSCASRTVVVEKPVAPVVVAPASPYNGAVLVGEEWRWRRGRYVYVAPHYVRPARARAWTNGHWRSTPRGFVWVRGGWR